MFVTNVKKVVVTKDYSKGILTPQLSPHTKSTYDFLTL